MIITEFIKAVKASQARVPVTPGYVIGPGDEIVLRVWGQVDIDYRAVVDRNGAINIPKVGTFMDGDLIRVFALSAKFDNAVTLRGNVAAPARYPWREGLRIKDVIPGKEALIVAEYWIKRNLAVGSAPGALGAAGALGGPGAAGAAGGPSALGGPGGIVFRNEVKRILPEINWDYAVVERLNSNDLTPMLIPFNLGKAVLEGDPGQNLVLLPGDVITVFSQDDIQVPIARRTKFVRVEGEFRVSGLYQAQPGETLRQLVRRVGGATPDAYFFGAEFTRDWENLLLLITNHQSPVVGCVCAPSACRALL